jgi:hypothetical protein
LAVTFINGALRIMTETLIAIMSTAIGYIVGNHLGIRKGWAMCEAYFISKVGEELDKLGASRE